MTTVEIITKDGQHFCGKILDASRFGITLVDDTVMVDTDTEWSHHPEFSVAWPEVVVLRGAK